MLEAAPDLHQAYALRGGIGAFGNVLGALTLKIYRVYPQIQHCIGNFVF